MTPPLNSNPYWAVDVAAAKEYGLPPQLLSAQQYIESGWNPSAVSPTGAFGISQFEPGTAQSWGVVPGTSPAAVKTQIYGEAALMSSLVKQEGSVTTALEAYNAGPGGVPYANSNGAAQYAAEIVGLAGSTGTAIGGGRFITGTGNPGGSSSSGSGSGVGSGAGGNSAGGSSGVTLLTVPLLGKVTIPGGTIVRGALLILGLFLVYAAVKGMFEEGSGPGEIVEEGTKSAASDAKKAGETAAQGAAA